MNVSDPEPVTVFASAVAGVTPPSTGATVAINPSAAIAAARIDRPMSPSNAPHPGNETLHAEQELGVRMS